MTRTVPCAAGRSVTGRRSRGYEGTSIDDLVKALNLHRGSLYKAFGSKRGLFLAVLRRYVEVHLANATRAAQVSADDAVNVLTRNQDLDLLLYAALERGHHDAQVAALVRRALELIEQATADPLDPPRASDPARRPIRAIDLLGSRLYERLHSDPSELSTPHQLTTKET
jgi:TetR/AcrR family transcriptional regulator, transcriptional repressor for nem operon